MKQFRMFYALVLPVILAACDQEPTAPNAFAAPQFLVVPAPRGEQVTVCKAYVGTVATDSFSFAGVNTPLVGANFRVAAESCRQVIGRAGDTIRVNVTENNIPAGVQLDSVVTYQIDGAMPSQGVPGTVVHTNLGQVTAGSVYVGGSVATGGLSGGLIVFYNSDTQQEEGEEGCTPGYWKNHLGSWSGFTSGATVASVFNVGTFTSLGNVTLIDALSFGGGSGATGAARNLLRAAVAALLNSSNAGLDYPSTTAEVIADVNAALASGDRATMLALAADLDADNNLGCPLN